MVIVGALFLGACGGEVFTLVRVDLGSLTVPVDIDALHLEISDMEGLLTERSFALLPNEQPSITLRPGPRTEKVVDLKILGLLEGKVVAESELVSVDFSQTEITVLLSNP